MEAAGGASIIIRARNEQHGLVACLEALGAQQPAPPLEVIVVDSGSHDRTREVAAAYGALVLEIDPRDFTFGGALNRGAEAARGDVLVALSAHAVAADSGWLQRLLAAFTDPAVACACGDRYGPDAAPLTAPILQDAALARRRPAWGYSNAAGGVRAALWREHPFRTDLPACEDKEWALHWLDQGWVCRVDPALAVDHDHTHDSARAIFGRARREAAAFRMFLGDTVPPYGPGQLARDWWSDTRWYRSPLRARLSHRRAARLLGTYAGGR